MIHKDGILLIDKESGPSSFKVVEKVKGALKAKKAGHAGTLDPFATGLLVVLLNKGTKLSSFLMSQDKVYQAALRLGIETDTQDLSGKVVRKGDIGRITGGTIKEKSLQFLGSIKQIPPRYSAVHHQGKRAYELARQGIAFDLPERRVTINYINLLSIELPTVWIEVGCSSGTYIRALATDLGRALGCGAHLTSLRRVKSGSFLADNAFTVPEISQRVSSNCLDEVIMGLKDSLTGMAEVEISGQLARKIRAGYQPQKGEISIKSSWSRDYSGSLKVITKGELVAVLRETTGGYDIIKVFV